MTLEEAIRRLGNLAIHHRDDTFPENEKAIRLGIEALQTIKWLHDTKVIADDIRLPGETEK